MKIFKSSIGFALGCCLLLVITSYANAQSATCVYSVSNDWGTGLTGAITITNNSTLAINGWTVGWTYAGSNRISNVWNAALSGTNPYSATALSWNSSIQPGQNISFGFQVDKKGGATEIPVVTGSICGSSISSSSSKISSSINSSSMKSSSLSSLLSSSSKSSSLKSSSTASSNSSTKTPSSSLSSSSASRSNSSSKSSVVSSSSKSIVISSSVSSSSSSVVAACTVPKADNTWQTTNSCQTLAPTCTAGTWLAPKDGGENGGALRLETAHFAIYWKDGTNITLAAAQTAANSLEEIWSSYFGSPLFFPEPYCSSTQKWKAAVHFDNDYPLWGGGWSRNGINYMGMWIGPLAAADKWGLAHEFMHGVQSSTQGFPDCGGVGCWIYESHANWMPHQIFRDNPHCSEMLPNMPHLYYGNTRDRYCNWQFLNISKINRVQVQSIICGLTTHQMVSAIPGRN